MQVIIVKDGTIPIAVAKVVQTDGPDGANLQRYVDDQRVNGLHEVFEAFTVPDGTRFLFVGWSDGEGFNVLGFERLNDALDVLDEDATPNAIAESNIDGMHWALTYGEDTDDESYGHVFTIAGL